ncbi:hypothetical protein [Microbacterium sp. NPDC055665]
MKRSIAGIGVSLMALSLFSLASPAVAASPVPSSASESSAQSCDEQVDTAVESAGLEGKAIDFSCTPAGATVELATPESIELSTQHAAEGDDGQASSRSAFPCSVATPYSRWITNPLEEKYSVCVIYGQRQPSGETVWWDAIYFGGTNWPGWNGHMLTGAADVAYTNPGSVTFEVALVRNVAGFGLQEVDFHQYQGILGGSSIGGPTYLYNTSSVETGIFHFRINKMQIEVPMFGFSKYLPEVYEGYRFVCNRNDDNGQNQCRWPDGNEAVWA